MEMDRFQKVLVQGLLWTITELTFVSFERSTP